MRGYCLMIGGDKAAVQRLDPIFKAIAPARARRRRPRSIRGRQRQKGREQVHHRQGTSADSYLHCGPSGAGHFVKMVHNGMEYGIMAAYARG